MADNNTSSPFALAADAYVVHLELVPTPRSVRPARSVAASLGVDIGFDVDELDDIRVAVQEAMALMIAHTDNKIDMVVAPDGDALVVGLSCQSSEPLPDASHIARQLLDVLVAAHSVESIGHEQRIWLWSHPAVNARD